MSTSGRFSRLMGGTIYVENVVHAFVWASDVRPRSMVFTRGFGRETYGPHRGLFVVAARIILVSKHCVEPRFSSGNRVSTVQSSFCLCVRRLVLTVDRAFSSYISKVVFETSRMVSGAIHSSTRAVISFVLKC